MITRDVRHTHNLLIKHILALRQIPEIAHTTLVFIFESNLAFESQHLLHAIDAAGIKRWVSLSEGQASTHGWLTTNARKEQMCLLVREALTVGKIAFHRNFFSLELGAAAAKRQLKDELMSYCVVRRFCVVCSAFKSASFDAMRSDAQVVEPAKTMFGKVRSYASSLLKTSNDALDVATAGAEDIHRQGARCVTTRLQPQCALVCVFHMVWYLLHRQTRRPGHLVATGMHWLLDLFPGAKTVTSIHTRRATRVVSLIRCVVARTQNTDRSERPTTLEARPGCASFMLQAPHRRRPRRQRRRNKSACRNSRCTRERASCSDLS